MTEDGSYPVTYTGWYDAECRPVRGVVPVEEVVALHVNGQPLVRLMCTPTQVKELALGFLFNAELIEGPEEVDDVKVLTLPSGDRWVDIWLQHELDVPQVRAITSGCSGGAVFGDVAGADYRIESELRVTPQQVTGLMKELSHGAALHRRTGGLHVAALAEGEQLACVVEDIGRHNAVDKIAGFCLSRGWTTQDHLLLSSGRISSEMVHKVAHMGIPIVVSWTSPTSLSVQLAQAWGITLIGYTHRRSFRIYAGAQRVTT